MPGGQQPGLFSGLNLPLCWPHSAQGKGHPSSEESAHGLLCASQNWKDKPFKERQQPSPSSLRAGTSELRGPRATGKVQPGHSQRPRWVVEDPEGGVGHRSPCLSVLCVLPLCLDLPLPQQSFRLAPFLPEGTLVCAGKQDLPLSALCTLVRGGGRSCKPFTWECSWVGGTELRVTAALWL